jgi:hypothetical protein
MKISMFQLFKNIFQALSFEMYLLPLCSCICEKVSARLNLVALTKFNGDNSLQFIFNILDYLFKAVPCLHHE